ncbi:ATP-binding protein [Paractinoplanes toevensis]|uniref:ATP-binding protein n=1 Tax=Paractinoplanes toevensis TaxID=571911 RepID=A0A919WCP5_9ACTN|nr:SbcC/MukB-like Walker B domain-containing protein [Actinoplanes toevensis]GIM97824.1 ATP-binding protein [Actinoplanes toevensis]
MTTPHATAGSHEEIMLPLVVTDGQDRAQFRISEVQILNWGAYAGLQTMTVARSGTAIVGPSGRGKSTLLDAMASVILPNPQEFNQAARDDRGKKRERTVYSYARGHTDQRKDENRRSATTNYLRPPGGPGFPSGAAITWETRDGRCATSFRLAWVGPDADGPEAINGATVYGFVHDRFDLAQLNGITAIRQGASPLSKTSLERLIHQSRGDVVDSSQARVHAKMRSVMGMGSTDESQRLAMQLLRRAQASKGIFSINALFKEFVLTEPLALTRWDVALEAYREASRLYEEFETARRRTETLKPLPQIAEKYRAAGADYIDKNRLLKSNGDGPTRIHVWHAEKVAEWAETTIDDNRLAKAVTDEEHAAAFKVAEAADLREKDTIAQLIAAGGDRSELIKVQLQHLKEELERLEARRRRFESRLAVFELSLPTSPGDVTLTHASLDNLAIKEEKALEVVTETATKAAGQLWQLRQNAEAKKREIAGLRARHSLIPEDADERRNRIASHLDIEIDQLRYAGELLQLKPEHRRWEKAVVGLLLPLASTLLVGSHDFARVRRYVHDHDMRGSMTLAPAVSDSPGPMLVDGGVPALLDIADHPFQGWLAGELNETANYYCVETDAELDHRRPHWARGSITPAGMRTGSRNRFIKDDRRLRYPWLGWDTRRTLLELGEELESIQRELQVADVSADEAGRRRESARSRLEELRAIRSDLTWDGIDTSAAQQRMGELETQLAQANSPEVAHLTKLLKGQRDSSIAASREVKRLEDEQTKLDKEWGNLVTVVDEAKDRVEAGPPLTHDERAALAATPFTAPVDTTAVTASLKAAMEHLRAQIERHKDDREKLETAVVGHIAAYRNLDERTARETDGTIDSLPAVLAIYRQLVTDDLPRAKDAWLAKVDEDMNRQLRGLLVQIDDDARTIKRGLAPINDVLQHVPFRSDATLSIESVERPSGDLKEFRQIITRYTSNTVGMDIERNADQVEKSFTRLRKHLSRLDDQSRAGDAWRRRVFDAREHVEFQAIETRPDGIKVIHDGVSGMSGGEGQELIAFILGAALRFRLGEGHEGPPSYASIILDEGFVKADSDYTGRALSALQALGFQLIVGAPREKATAFEDYVESVAYININVDDPARVRIYPMTMKEALRLEGEASE